MTVGNNGNSGHKRIFFLSCPRSASHLFMRMIAIHKQPNLAVHPPEGDEYFFLPPTFVRMGMVCFDKAPQDLERHERQKLKDTFQQSADNTETFIREAEAKGESLFIKEHAQIIADPVTQCKILYGENGTTEDKWVVKIEGHSEASPENPTVLPDAYLRTWLPVFLIRHPALVIESLHRAFSDTFSEEFAMEDSPASRASFKLSTTLRITRQLFDWYSINAQEGKQPIVIDSTDMVHDPAVVPACMAALGFDPATQQSTWSKWTEEQTQALGKMEKRMVSTLVSSTGVQTDKAPLEINIDEKVQKWSQEFGEEPARQFKDLLHEAMPDYEYLYSKRLQAKPAQNGVNGTTQNGVH